MPDSLSRRNLIAMIRIQTNITRGAYFWAIFDVIVFAITSVTCIFLFILFVRLSFVAFRVTLNDIELLIGGWFVIAVIIGYVIRGLCRAIRVLQGLQMLSRATSSPTATFSWSRFLKFSLPSWLYAEEVLYDPSPTSILDHVQGPALTTEELSQLAKDLMEPEREKSSSLSSILISLSYEVTISVRGRVGTLGSLRIANENWASIIALLATRRSWMPRDEILRLVYGKAGASQQARLTTDTARINQEILKLINESISPQEANEVLERIPSRQVGNSETSNKKVDVTLDVFENMMIDKLSYWRLSPICEIDECNTLVTLYRRVQEAKESKLGTAVPGREEMRMTCGLLMRTIGRGFMAGYQQAEAKGRRPSTTIWPWTSTLYETYRNQFLDILEYAAGQEAEIVKSSENREEKGDARKWAAQLYRWIVEVSIGIIPDRIKAEEALAKCLQLYRGNHDFNQAESIARQFKQRMREIDATWKINPKVRKIWPEVIGEETETQ